MSMLALTEREKLLLSAIVRQFILQAVPVASNHIVRGGRFPLSAASIRNIMAKLEEKGYIYQPHTSSGRVPTTAGYRIFVDHIMKRGRLSPGEIEKIRNVVADNPSDYENLLREATRIMAHLSRQLSIFVSPQMDQGTFLRLDINRLNSERILLIITIQSGMVKTIILEIPSEVPDEQLEMLNQVLNERLHGLRLKEIRTKFGKIFEDIQDEDSGLIHLIVSRANRIFDFTENKEIYLTGTHNILAQPEFNDVKEVSGVVELLEDKDIVIHLFDDGAATETVTVRIGNEIKQEKMQNCSIITSTYRIGEVTGTLGIVGPTRMDYGRLISLVEFTSRILSDPFDQN